MVDTYTVHCHFEDWRCSDGCCSQWEEWWTVGYKDFQFPRFETEEEALKFILEREGVEVKVIYEDE